MSDDGVHAKSTIVILSLRSEKDFGYDNAALPEVSPFRLNKYMSRTRFGDIMFYYIIQINILLRIMMGSSTCAKRHLYGCII